MDGIPSNPRYPSIANNRQAEMTAPHALPRRPSVRPLLIHAAGQEAAVHTNCVPGNKTGRVGRQKDSRADQFFQSAEPPHGSSYRELSLPFRAVQQRGVQISTNTPGHTAFTQTPRWAHSIASDFVSETTAALLAEYAATSNSATKEESDAILMMRPIVFFRPCACQNTLQARSVSVEVCFQNRVPLRFWKFHRGQALGASRAVHKDLNTPRNRQVRRSAAVRAVSRPSRHRDMPANVGPMRHLLNCRTHQIFPAARWHPR